MSSSGLDRCACKQGFFTLRDCEAQPVAACDICSRRICEAHLAPRVGRKVCVECAARQEQDRAVGTEGPQPTGAAGGRGSPTAAPGAIANQDLLDEDATQHDLPYRYRRRYYSDWGYSPMWWGSYDPYWGDSDYRVYEGDDDDGGGFGDS